MKIHVFQHAEFEGPGAIGGWASARGHEVAATLFGRHGARIPPLETVDWLVVLGGGMSVHQTERHPWLVEEKRAIERAMAAERTVLGICLGSQLVADVLGAAVRANEEKEIGRFPVRKTPEGAALPLLDDFSDEAEVFHWHGDTWELPAGAVRVAASDACANQGFVLGDRVVGLQFHPEMTPSIAAGIARADAEELAAGGRWVQPAGEVLRDGGRFGAANRMLWGMLDRLAAKGGR